MKKLLALMLAVLMIFALAACGENTATHRRRKNKATDSTTLPPAADKELSLGKVIGTTYENEFIGIGCTLDNGWTFKTEKEIKEANSIVMDAAGEELAEALKNATIIYDMSATGPNGMDSINVNLQKGSKSALNKLDIATNYVNCFPSVKQMLQNMGFTNISYTIDTVTIDGEIFDTMNIEASINGILLYETLFSIKCDGYLANITVGTYYSNNTAEILESFYLTD